MSRGRAERPDEGGAGAADEVRPLQPFGKDWGPIHGLEEVIADRYRLSYLVGRGSFAHVYRATHIKVSSIAYAVKVLRRGASEDPSLRERFRLEAEAAASIRSAHVAPVIDYGETKGGLPFLVMPLLVGLPCDRLLQRVGQLRPADVARFSLHVLDALEVAHDRGIIHRDLKPSNIFIEQAPRGRHPVAKVLDFGIAKLLEESSLVSVISTAVNSFIGTPAFASPEALAGEPDPCGDLYSLGHSMANMLDGRAPYEDEKTQALAIQRHLSPEPVPLGAHTRESGLYEVIARACQKAWGDRFATAAEMAAAIRATGVADLDVPPLVFEAGGAPEHHPADDLPTSVERVRPFGPTDSSGARRAALASTVGPEDTSEAPQTPIAPVDARPEEGPEEAVPARSRRWVIGAVALLTVGLIAAVLSMTRSDPSPERHAPPSAATEAAAANGAPAPTEGAGVPEPAGGSGASLAVVLDEGTPAVGRVAPAAPSLDPAVRQASLAVARASRVGLDNIVDLAGPVAGIEAYLGDARLGELPLRGAFVPSARPLALRFVGDGFELTHVVQQSGPVVYRVEPPPARRRRPRSETEPPPRADALVAPPAEAEPPGEPGSDEERASEGPSEEPSLFGPRQSDLRNPFD